MASSADIGNTPPATDPWTQAYAYGLDAWQRSVLYLDVMRQRGNQYLEHMSQTAPNVLSMSYSLVMDGRTLPRPVNYGLLRIDPPEGVAIDPLKRPFLVVDPRAGHGPGIGGFKPESEIGVAVRAGHPCYFATFLPEPMPTQTVEDVMRAEARFLEEIISLHPEAEGKPVVVGNCQAGWQIMMTAAMRPELFGPIIIAGAPLSYWAGWRGKNPMRYAGGLLGGSWMTAMASDLGAGTFDGAWLVQNFENLNPANTLWAKQYNLYANVDTEAQRYLSFEKWWGGHVFLNEPEIQYIVDNLFVGNRLSTGGLVTSDGIRIDLRNIRSPIIVFCSKGDNITPPPQALGWITDLYEDDDQVRAHGQTIVYAVHETIGHLGIFVSGSVARKEHQEFTSNIDMIDVLPPGLYQAEIADKTEDTLNSDLASGDYVMSFARRHIEDVRAIVEPEPEDDKRFAAVARASDINLGLYRSFVQPWVRAMVTPELARWMQRMHPLRLTYEMISDSNPLVAPIKDVADRVRQARQPVDADNPMAIAERQASTALESTLDNWRILRDDAQEQLFMSLYGSPIVQDITGLGGHDQRARARPGISPEHRQFMAERSKTLREGMATGGVREAAIRMLLGVTSAVGEVDERSYAVIRRMRAEKDDLLGLQTFKDIVRDQALMMTLDAEAAVAAMPKMLEGASAQDIRRAARDIEEVLGAAGPLSDSACAKLEEMKTIFDRAAKLADKAGHSRKAATPRKRSAPGKASTASGGSIAEPDAQLVVDPAQALTHGASAGELSALTPTTRGPVESAVPVGHATPADKRKRTAPRPAQQAAPAKQSAARTPVKKRLVAAAAKKNTVAAPANTSAARAPAKKSLVAAAAKKNTVAAPAKTSAARAPAKKRPVSTRSR
ncbi:MAG: DUF3141 domain-containing protein [Burkholderiaceae bacterium]